MSDPSFDGFMCHGPMQPIYLPDIAQLQVAAWLCHCGVWRHAFPRALESLRERTTYYMDLNLQSLIEDIAPDSSEVCE